MTWVQIPWPTVKGKTTWLLKVVSWSYLHPLACMPPQSPYNDNTNNNNKDKEAEFWYVLPLYWPTVYFQNLSLRGGDEGFSGHCRCHITLKVLIKIVYWYLALKVTTLMCLWIISKNLHWEMPCLALMPPHSLDPFLLKLLLTSFLKCACLAWV